MGDRADIEARESSKEGRKRRGVGGRDSGAFVHNICRNPSSTFINLQQLSKILIYLLN
jgi:hypothetical protein